MPSLTCLVIGSCTGKKDDSNCPDELKLSETDFNSAVNLARAERKSRAWLKPAGEMYKGPQHTLMMKEITRLREGLKEASFDVAVVSAGYGLISERQLIAPYDITFKNKGLRYARARGRFLQIPTKTRELVAKYEIVFFLLGKEYLASLGGPPEPARGQKFVYFGTAAERFRSPHSNMITLPAAQPEATRYKGAGVTGIKGQMFDLLSQGITTHPIRLKSLVSDRTSTTILGLINGASKFAVAER